MIFIKKVSILFIAIFSCIANAQHSSEEHTDGIEKYYRTEKLQAYLDQLDPSELPYMFASKEDGMVE